MLYELNSAFIRRTKDRSQFCSGFLFIFYFLYKVMSVLSKLRMQLPRYDMTQFYEIKQRQALHPR